MTVVSTLKPFQNKVRWQKQMKGTVYVPDYKDKTNMVVTVTLIL